MAAIVTLSYRKVVHWTALQQKCSFHSLQRKTGAVGGMLRLETSTIGCHHYLHNVCKYGWASERGDGENGGLCPDAKESSVLQLQEQTHEISHANFWHLVTFVANTKHKTKHKTQNTKQKWCCCWKALTSDRIAWKWHQTRSLATPKQQIMYIQNLS